MPQDEFGEKTEAPTQRKLQEAREEGQVARSQDLTAALTLLGAVVLLSIFGQKMFVGMRVLIQTMLTGSFTDNAARANDVGRVWAAGSHIAMQMIAPVAIGVMVIAILAGLLQVGVLVTFKPLMPQFGKLSPIRGFSNLFSMRGMMRLAMSVGKVSVVSAVAVVCIRNDITKVLALVYLPAPSLLAASAALIWSLSLKIAIVLLLLGVADFAWQKWQNIQEMKMTKQEVKEEFKRMEGDPLIKQRRMQVARQIAMQRIRQDVPKADVIVTNPTHFAVALKYDGKTMAAPKVVAKGSDLLAMRIREIAIMHNVPIVERPPLARALYKNVEVGREIPGEFYAAVAEILAYVYRVGGRKSA